MLQMVKKDHLKSVLDKIISSKKSFPLNAKQLQKDIYFMIWHWNYILEAEATFFLSSTKAIAKLLL